MPEYNRIKYLRKEILKMNQEDFSIRINISRSNLGNIETEKINLTERVANDICREFNVRKDWLIKGINPIFEKENDPLSDEIKSLYDKLTDKNKQYLYGYMQRLIEEQNSKK